MKTKHTLILARYKIDPAALGKSVDVDFESGDIQRAATEPKP